MTILAAIGERSPPNPVITVGYDLAEAYGDELVVLHVVPLEEFDSHREAVQQIDEFADYSLRQEEGSAARFAREMVDSTLDACDWERVSTEGRVGDPVDEILAVAGEVDARYLVVGGRRRSPAGKAIFGSITQSVLLNADRPVTTVMTDG